ncbi:hypothetical protein GCM10027176_58880 [Actinoallomurus bryophytorum]
MPLLALAEGEGEGVGLPVIGGDMEGGAPGQFGAGAPGLLPPGERFAIVDVWWWDRPGEDTRSSGTATRAAAATTPATTSVARERPRGEAPRGVSGVTSVCAAATGLGEEPVDAGTTAGNGSGGTPTSGGDVVTRGSTIPRRTAGSPARVASVVDISRLPHPSSTKRPSSPTD